MVFQARDGAAPGFTWDPGGGSAPIVVVRARTPAVVRRLLASPWLVAGGCSVAAAPWPGTFGKALGDPLGRRSARSLWNAGRRGTASSAVPSLAAPRTPLLPAGHVGARTPKRARPRGDYYPGPRRQVPVVFVKQVLPRAGRAVCGVESEGLAAGELTHGVCVVRTARADRRGRHLPKSRCISVRLCKSCITGARSHCCFGRRSRDCGSTWLSARACRVWQRRRKSTAALGPQTRVRASRSSVAPGGLGYASANFDLFSFPATSGRTHACPMSLWRSHVARPVLPPASSS